MAEQGRIVMPTIGSTGSRGRLTSNTIKVYNNVTSYRASYGARAQDSHQVNFTSYLGHPSGTGFTANQRPAIYYRPSLDHIDNPQFGLVLSDSFTSQTKRHYLPCIRSDFSRPLPNLLNKPRDSGFHQLESPPKTESALKEKTEHQRAFVPHHLTPTVSQNNVVMGRKGETGFTEGTDLQINTFQEKNSRTVEPRQTANSVMKNDFLPPSFLQGIEEISGLCSHSSRETGFTRGAIAPLACPTSALMSPQTNNNAPTEKTIGKKEPSGSILNAPNYQAFPKSPFDHSHFTTQYKSKFCHYTDVEKLRSGHTGAGIITAKMDTGYNRRDTDRFIFRG
ncbi:protein phosphatase 1 regulatory subunit 32 [Anabas testudineus]|uniref:Protein phosphatase 1 regulatory subunit 32 n=1 Tax=Anabas testudineus TaxID=64144 RepID=A0A3Q1JKG2_ANATE|nr:protein phosphatase 1 regulatory subunit 32 [Anabas testudineus]XP_026221785.1 protein phosphatase 1 regulatory subunit 32 [Anabas testudineus]XP_026221786.1 protein phosphatase 1 regulatory subunit 32 [Anabas testudineus]